MFAHRSIFGSAVKVLIGGTLGVVGYLWIAKMTIDQTHIGCYETGFMRSVIEASMLLAALLVEFMISDKSSLYRPVIYGLSSIPYAVLGALIVVGSKRRIIFVASILVTIWLGLSLCAWGFLMAAICA